METCIVCKKPIDKKYGFTRDNAYIWHDSCVDSDGNAIKENNYA